MDVGDDAALTQLVTLIKKVPVKKLSIRGLMAGVDGVYEASEGCRQIQADVRSRRE